MISKAELLLELRNLKREFNNKFDSLFDLIAGFEEIFCISKCISKKFYLTA